MADNADSDLYNNSAAQDETDWSVYIDSNNYQILGFLQMCIERRFHLAVQECFKKETSLADTDYWIHTGVGGSPQMESEVDQKAPRYCYSQGARIMGWSAHGSKCGGMPGLSDEVILKALQETLNRNSKKYPETWHLGFFAKERPDGNVEVLRLEPKTDE